MSSQLLADKCELDRVATNVSNITVTDFKAKSKQKIIDIVSEFCREQQYTAVTITTTTTTTTIKWPVAKCRWTRLCPPVFSYRN